MPGSQPCCPACRQALALVWTERSAESGWCKAIAHSTEKLPKEALRQPLLPHGERPRSPNGEELVPVAATALRGLLHQGYRKYGEVRTGPWGCSITHPLQIRLSSLMSSALQHEHLHKASRLPINLCVCMQCDEYRRLR